MLRSFAILNDPRIDVSDQVKTRFFELEEIDGAGWVYALAASDEPLSIRYVKILGAYQTWALPVAERRWITFWDNYCDLLNDFGTLKYRASLLGYEISKT